MLLHYCSEPIDFKPKFLIGNNGSGKTYQLNKIYESNPTKNLIISEEGELRTQVVKNKVIVDIKKKSYIIPSSDLNRGTGYRDVVDKLEEIDDRVLGIIKFCSDELEKLNNIISKSKGQEKIKKLMDILYSTLLNPIEMIMFDEPENFLDESYLNIISKLVRTISSAGIKVVIGTHSPLLCELCNVDIEDILMLTLDFEDGSPKYNQTHLTKILIKDSCTQIADKIEEIRKLNNYDMDYDVHLKLELCKHDHIFEKYLNYVLKTEEFYRALFYKTIYVVEGHTERAIVLNSRKNVPSNAFFYSSDGKSFIPMFAWVFAFYKKDIKILIDSDRIIKGKSETFRLQVAITEYLLSTYHNGTKVFETDLEKQFEIDAESFKRNNHLPDKWGLLKPLAAKAFFEDDQNRKEFMQFIGII